VAASRDIRYNARQAVATAVCRPRYKMRIGCRYRNHVDGALVVIRVSCCRRRERENAYVREEFAYGGAAEEVRVPDRCRVKALSVAMEGGR